MAIYNTASDYANTAIRAFLTKVGEYYLDKFNTGSGKGGRTTFLLVANKVHP